MQKLSNEQIDWIKNLIVDKIGCQIEEIEPATDVYSLGMDSLDYIEIVMEIEKHHNIEIPDIEAEKVRTFSSLIDVIEQSL
jgi:acyl carrier protein